MGHAKQNIKRFKNLKPLMCNNRKYKKMVQCQNVNIWDTLQFKLAFDNVVHNLCKWLRVMFIPALA